MKTIIILTSLFSLGILYFGCGLFEPEDPYKRAKEINRFFRCKVNGKEWANHSYDWFYGDISTIAYYSNTYSIKDRRGGLDIDIRNNKNENDQENIYIYIKSQLKLGHNGIISTKSSSGKCYGLYKKNDWVDYYLDTTYSNNLYITEMDSINSIIKGEFEFRCITEDRKDTVLVNDGEFDWKVYWYK